MKDLDFHCIWTQLRNGLYSQPLEMLFDSIGNDFVDAALIGNLNI